MTIGDVEIPRRHEAVLRAHAVGRQQTSIAPAERCGEQRAETALGPFDDGVVEPRTSCQKAPTIERASSMRCSDVNPAVVIVVKSMLVVPRQESVPSYEDGTITGA